jgi:ATP-dependent helicase/DNAse subunit B
MSAQNSLKDRMIKIEIDGSDFTPQQVRLIRSLNTMLAHVMVTDNEEEYFEGSAEVMRMCAALIKQAHFTDKLKGVDNISYAQQALEYSMDVLQEYVSSSKVVTYDN